MPRSGQMSRREDGWCRTRRGGVGSSCFFGAGLFLLPMKALALLADFPGLSPPEVAAAQSLQHIYDSYGPRALADSSSPLTPSEAALYNEARQLVENANEILNNGGPTSHSLGLDSEGVAKALQWVAPEEYNTQSKVGSQVVGAQVANILARLNFLRLGVRGLSVGTLTPAHGVEGVTAYQASGLAQARGGSAGSSLMFDSRWGLYLNGGYSDGRRDPTSHEDALKFATTGFTLGSDYRLDNRWVVGAALGYSESKANFNASLSTVDGDIQAKGWTGTLYSSANWANRFLDAFATFNHSYYDTVRRITYPSNNPLEAGINETALSNTSSTQFGLTVRGGYSRSIRALTLGLDGDLSYSRLLIDGYSESNAKQFDLSVGEQGIGSLTSSLGPKVNYAISERFGVVIPQLGMKWVHEFASGEHLVSTHFVSDTTGATLVVTGDHPDTNYFLFNMDVSAVFTHGLQAFLSYAKPLGLAYTHADSFSGGVRWEF